jgi:uncharacterized alkaline shock family protein YloU
MARQTDLGTVQIRNDVIGTIAALAAQEVEGVVGIWRGPLPLGNWLDSWIGRTGVKVEAQDQEVRIWLSLVVEYGVNLAQVAARVQDKVREVLERMTLLTAAEVNVRIHHVQPKRS